MQLDQKVDFPGSVPHSVFIYRPIAPRIHQKVCISTSLAQGKEQPKPRSRSGGPKTRIFRRCTYAAQRINLPTHCAQIAPEDVYRHQLGPRQRKFQFICSFDHDNVKSHVQMNQKFDFLDGVPHIFFIYRSIAPKLHQVCIDTSLA